MNSQDIFVKSKRSIWKKWSIAFRVAPIVAFVVFLKFLSHRYGYEVMELNALFTSLVAGTIFLIGFLISGVLSDYKESEKIPNELTASLKTLFDDAYTILKTKKPSTAKQFIDFQVTFQGILMNWFYKKERTKALLSKISEMNDFFVELDKEGVQAAYIIRMKNEQNNIRKLILRVDTIRDTSFIGSAYAIVEAMAFLTALGLIIIKIEPFYASIFLSSLITFLITYMIFLIKDLDNPFDYKHNSEGGTEVSLRPLHDVHYVLDEYSKTLK